MADHNWVDISEEIFKKVYNSGSDITVEANNKAYIALQYDANSISTTSATLRFVLRKDYAYELWDTFHILLDPRSDNYRTLHKLKTVYTRYSSQGNWPYYASTTFTVKKEAKDEEFSIPEFWICDDGWNVSGVPDSLTADLIYKNYKDGGYRGWPCRTIVESTAIPIEEKTTVVTNGSNATIDVFKDLGNNKVRISGTIGRENKNNKLDSVTLYYTTDGTDPASSSTRKFYSSDKNISTTGEYVGSLIAASGANYSKEIAITKKCTVRVYLVCVFEYNWSARYGKTDATYYVAPVLSGIPELSYKKSRLTIKEPWTFTWSAATKKNDDSPVAGYYLMLLRKAKGESDFKYVCKLTDAGNSHLGLTEETQTSANYYLRRESTSCTAIIEKPADFGFVPGDEVKLRITAYTWNAYNPKQTLQSDSAETPDSSYIVRNAGIANVKVNNEWREGQIYVKTKDGWQEAESVNIKANDSWHESQ
jgi:hypothetical protein